MNVAPSTVQRRSVLDFCLAPLRMRLGEGGGDVPSSLDIDDQVVPLDAFEQSSLAESMNGDGNSAKPWASLVTEGVAFRIGCKLKMAAWLQKKADSASLVTFIAAGLALTTEIQQMVDLLIVAGQVGSAKKLTQFRNRTLQEIKTVRRLLGDEEYSLAEVESMELVGPPRKSLPSRSSGPSPRGAGEYKPRKKELVEPLFGMDIEETAVDDEATHQRRVKRMGVFLFASTLIWMVFFMPRLFEPKAEVLKKFQFEHLPAVQAVTARPPSLYIEVEPQAWDALAPGDRREMLEEIGRIAIDAKYNGAQVKIENSGTVVGRWLREQGAQLVSGS